MFLRPFIICFPPFLFLILFLIICEIHHLLFVCISRFIDVIFQEQKIKEGLYMMGLKDGIFHLSWFLTYALQVNLFLFHLL